MSDLHDRLDAALRAAADHGDFVVANVVSTFVDTERQRDPALLRDWLDAHAVALLTEWSTARLRNHRRQTLTRNVSVFAEAAEAFAEGDDTGLRSLLAETFVIDAQNTRRALADMTVLDLDYAATQYEDGANSLLMRAAFLRAVARTVTERGGTTVADVLSEHDLAQLPT